ncbi:hypothetical protein [Sphingomonas sp. MMS24-J13]|uniref:hypothetical protein n=1 Tax=Sphingomonas sp. MMS24-J13 TaxID=3238686 RepID=UPI00384E95B2
MKILHLAGALALALFACVPSLAQVGLSIKAPAGYVPGVVSYCDDGTGHAAICSTTSVTQFLPQLSTTDRGGTFGTSAAQLMPANASRHFVVVQVQSTTASCYINGTTTATADYHSLQIVAGAYYESATHVGTGAISIICTGASTSVYAREG